MSLSMMLSLVGLLQLLLALLGCAWALRAHKSHLIIVLASVCGAVLGGAFSIVPLMQMSVRTDEGLDVVLYRLVNLLLSSAILGVVIGLGGIVVQTLGRRRARSA
jgi:predicted neutral ceramidase superfamily lipid hydrolase